jgi:beta-mannosidase
MWTTGLDTVAKVFVNGNEIGNSENMFRRYSFDIKSELERVSELGVATEISVEFESPISYSERKFLEQKNTLYVVPPVCQYDGVCHANHIRKMQSSFR